MSTVCVARVRGWAGVGACSADGVGDGPDPAGERLGHHSRSSAFSSAPAQRQFGVPCLRNPVEQHNGSLLAYSRCRRSSGPLMPAGPRKPVKRNNGRFYWLTRDVSLVFVDFHAPGRILGTQTFRAAGGCPHVAYTHFSGCRRRRILPTQTFRGAGVLQFTYIHFRRRRAPFS